MVSICNRGTAFCPGPASVSSIGGCPRSPGVAVSLIMNPAPSCLEDAPRALVYGVCGAAEGGVDLRNFWQTMCG